MSFNSFGEFGYSRPRPTTQISADQDLLMKIGIAANGNVNIQSRYSAVEYETQVRLTCKVCSSCEYIRDTSFLTRNGEVCAHHRHEGTIFESANKALTAFGRQSQLVVNESLTAETGRRFREEEYDDNE
jgi:hypothetical protein